MPLSAAPAAPCAAPACYASVRPPPTRLRPARAGNRRPPPLVRDCRGEPQFPPQPASSPYGMNVNALAYQPGDPISDATYAQAATLLRQAGTAWVRIEAEWTVIGADPASRTSDAAFHWSRLDQTVNRALCRGFNVVGVLEYTPAWAVSRTVADGGRRHTDLPDDVRDWARFVRATVERYPDVRAWAIWNEPNTPTFFNGRRGATGPHPEREDELVADYATLVAAAAPSIRQPTDGRGPRQLIAPEVGRDGAEEWIRGLLLTQHQGANVDVVSVHDYGDAAGIARAVDGLAAATGVRPWTWPVWLTEAGTIGCVDEVNARAAGQPAGIPPYCVGRSHTQIQPDSQAAHLRALMTATTASPAAAHWAKTFYWHGFLETYDSTSVPIRGDERGIVQGLQRGVVHGTRALDALRALAAPATASPR